VCNWVNNLSGDDSSPLWVTGVWNRTLVEDTDARSFWELIYVRDVPLPGTFGLLAFGLLCTGMRRIGADAARASRSAAR